MTSKKTENLFFAYSFEFLNHYIALQGFSAATKASYRDTLKALRTYLNGKNISIGKFTFEQCTRNFVISFLEWLKNNKNLSNSSHRHTSCRC